MHIFNDVVLKYVSFAHRNFLVLGQRQYECLQTFAHFVGFRFVVSLLRNAHWIRYDYKWNGRRCFLTVSRISIAAEHTNASSMVARSPFILFFSLPVKFDVPKNVCLQKAFTPFPPLSLSLYFSCVVVVPITLDALTFPRKIENRKQYFLVK